MKCKRQRRFVTICWARFMVFGLGVRLCKDLFSASVSSFTEVPSPSMWITTIGLPHASSQRTWNFVVIWLSGAPPPNKSPGLNPQIQGFEQSTWAAHRAGTSSSYRHEIPSTLFEFERSA